MKLVHFHSIMEQREAMTKNITKFQAATVMEIHKKHRGDWKAIMEEAEIKAIGLDERRLKNYVQYREKKRPQMLARKKKTTEPDEETLSVILDGEDSSSSSEEESASSSSSSEEEEKGKKSRKRTHEEEENGSVSKKAKCDDSDMNATIQLMTLGMMQNMMTKKGGDATTDSLEKEMASLRKEVHKMGKNIKEMNRLLSSKVASK